MSDIETCGRCGAVIATMRVGNVRPHEFVRHQGQKTIDRKQITLCSLCEDDVWEVVFEEDIDRSDKADPIPLEQFEESIERYQKDLDELLGEIRAEKSRGDADV